MASFFPILLGTHIVLAIGLFLPSILLPFALRARRATVESGSRLVRALLWAQSNGTIVVGLGLALTGAGLVIALGADILRQPWLMVALAIYFSNLAIAFFIQRPSLRRLVGIRASADDQAWARPRPPAAVPVLPDGRPGRHDRLPDELEAGAVVNEPDCLFCRIVAGEIPSTRVHEDDLVIAFRDIAPRAPTHILLIPRRHIASAADLVEADGPLLGRLFAVAADLARSEGIADGGYRLVSNVGRWGGQTRRPPPFPPDGRAIVRLAPGLSAIGRRRRSVRDRRSAIAVAAVRRRLRADRRASRDVPAGVGRAITDRFTRGQPDQGGARPRARGGQPRARRHAGSGAPGGGAVAGRRAAGRLPGDAAGRPDPRLHRGLRVQRRGAARRTRRPRNSATSRAGPAGSRPPRAPCHVLRQVGSTVVLYDGCPAPPRIRRAPDIQRALETLGVGFPIGG